MATTLIALPDWVERISREDRKRLIHHVFRFDPHPRKFMELMTDLRKQYDFIPAQGETKQARRGV